jgi:hypothetical protein
VAACAATPQSCSDEESIDSGWPARIQPAATDALDLLRARGRFSSRHRRRPTVTHQLSFWLGIRIIDCCHHCAKSGQLTTESDTIGTAAQQLAIAAWTVRPVLRICEAARPGFHANELVERGAGVFGFAPQAWKTDGTQWHRHPRSSPA